MYGAILLDELGRCFMMLAGLVGALASYILLTTFRAESARNPNLSYGVVVSTFLFGINFAWGFTPPQMFYAVECLEKETRARGSGLNFLFVNIAMVLNTYGISVGIDAICICVEIVIIHFIFVETAGETLEGMGNIFAAKNP